MSKEYQTDRSRRLEAVRSGQRETAVDRRQTTEPRSRDITSRSEQNRIASNIADEIDVDREGVGTVNRTDGLDVFLRSSGTDEFEEEVSSDFASSADYVRPTDVNPRVDPEQIEASPTIPTGRRDDIAERARSQSAAETNFIKSDDLRAEVSSRGVESLAIEEDRRDDIRTRTASSLASDDQFLKPQDFDVDVGERGIEDASLTDRGRRRGAAREFSSETSLDVTPTEVVKQSDGFGLGEEPRRQLAAREFEDSTPLSDVGPDQLVEQSDGFGLPTSAKRRSAARRLESEFNQFDSGELDPSEDVRQLDDGFGLARDEAREVLTDRINEQTSVSVSPGEIDIELNDGEYEAFFRRQV